MYELAALNLARMKYDLDDPRMADFVDNLEPINTLGDESPGAVWRYQTEDGDATAERAFDDEQILLNLTVWEDVESLHAFTYRSVHTDFLRRRREWFDPPGDLPVVTLWWIPAGHRPTTAEARAKAEYLRDNGPSPDAFGFKDRFPPPHHQSDPVEQSLR